MNILYFLHYIFFLQILYKHHQFIININLFIRIEIYKMINISLSNLISHSIIYAILHKSCPIHSNVHFQSLPNWLREKDPANLANHRYWQMKIDVSSSRNSTIFHNAIQYRAQRPLGVNQP